MTANVQPIFVLTPFVGMAQISSANTNLNGTGSLGTVRTGSTNGDRISRITIKAAGTVTAGMVRLFIDDGAGNVRLWKEISVSATVPSATVQAFEYILSLFGENALVLPSGYILKASTEKAETFNVIAEGGAY